MSKILHCHQFLSTQYQSNTELLLVSSGSKRSSIQGGDSSVVHWCSFMPGPNCEEGVLGSNTGWELVMCGELASSSTFAALQDSVPVETLTLERIQTLSFSTVSIDYS